LGLNIAQAVDMGLESETFSRKKELSEALNFTIQEKTYFEGTKTGKKCWIARRVELNAMSAGELIELIESGINRHVEHKKLIPPTTVLINEWDQQIYNLVGKNLTQAIYRRLSLNAVIGRIAETFKPGDVRGVILKHFNNHPEQSWREAIEADVNEVIDSEVIDKEAENILKDLAA